MKLFFLLSCIIFSAIVCNAQEQQQQGGDTILCYYGAWAKWRQGDGKFTIQDINPMLCTHIVYAFIGLNADGSINPLGSTGDYPAFIGLKQQNPNVKLLISMGGWNMGSTTFSDVTNDNSLRATMVENVYNYVTSNGFDGFDIDWEYPGQRGGAASDRESYVYFLRDLSAKFAGTGLIITAAVGADIQDMGPTSYDVPNMNMYLDYFNVMTYDYHASYDGVTGENSPLYGMGNLNINASIYGWISQGATPSKLLVGLPFYGHTFILENPSDNGIGAPTAGPGAAGPYSQQAGTLEYVEICQDLNAGGWTTVFDEIEEVPYSYQTQGSEWIGYDNQQSLGLKVNYAKEYGLGGVMIWSLEGDDAYNVCGEGYDPLLTAVNSAMNNGATPTLAPAPVTLNPSDSMQPTLEPASSEAVTSAPSTATATATNTCQSAGFFISATNCAAYYECVANGSGGFSQYPFNCPTGLLFDTQIKSCNYASDVTSC